MDKIIRSTIPAPSLIQKPAYSKANSSGSSFNLGTSGKVLGDFLELLFLGEDIVYAFELA